MKKIIITTSILLSSLMLIIIYQLSQLTNIGRYQISTTSVVLDDEVYVLETEVDTENGNTRKSISTKYDFEMRQYSSKTRRPKSFSFKIGKERYNNRLKNK